MPCPPVRHKEPLMEDPGAQTSNLRRHTGGPAGMRHTRQGPGTRGGAATVVVVGYAFMAKKMGRMEKIVGEAAAAAAAADADAAGGVRIEFQPLDLSRELHEQGIFDVLLHKLSEDIMMSLPNRAAPQSSQHGCKYAIIVVAPRTKGRHDSSSSSGAQSANAHAHAPFAAAAASRAPRRRSSGVSAARLARLERYLERRGGACACVDPVDRVNDVINRVSTLEVLRAAHARNGGAAGGMPRPPRYTVIDAGTRAGDVGARVAAAGLAYPLICKPIQACGTQGSHTMLVVLDAGSLDAVTVPIVVQEPLPGTHTRAYPRFYVSYGALQPPVSGSVAVAASQLNQALHPLFWQEYALRPTVCSNAARVRPPPLHLPPLVPRGHHLHAAVDGAPHTTPPQRCHTSLAAAAAPQEYCNHDARLFKVCVVGDNVQMSERPSLPNLPPGLTGSVFFDSQKPYPTMEDFTRRSAGHTTAAAAAAAAAAPSQCSPATAAGLAAEEEHVGTDAAAAAAAPDAAAAAAASIATATAAPSQPPAAAAAAAEVAPPPPPQEPRGARPPAAPRLSMAAARAAAARMRDAFGLSLFGFDLIVERDTGDVVVIDVNYFPSFRDFTEFPAALRGHLRAAAVCARSGGSAAAAAAVGDCNGGAADAHDGVDGDGVGSVDSGVADSCACSKEKGGAPPE
ncbi:inositol 1, 3, 4-trisphosphate 5/6-kinase-domain-containing protein [Tribonema minus]|uniref:Inositol 1, 3, 4-trisphosphate 5/6-kinase-domain-containing protein n=1 Tax=Tribonema minus TaxID=303371 RepID=A0A836CEG3_9STRA|nr:inositol 1, 3, 4-trisphosphate 5/6-kinase-domain-containing protein [Tribonema minus]